MSASFIVAFVIYFCALIGIGLIFAIRQRSLGEFMIGNRSTNYWVTAIATQASDMGIWIFAAFPAAVFTRGLFECWTAIGLTVFMFLTWHFIAPRLRSATEHYQNMTLSSYFTRQFHDTHGIIGFTSAFIAILFFTFYIASGLVGLGRFFAAVFMIEYHTGIFISLGTVLLLTLCGGFLAVMWTNLFQGIFLLMAIIIVPVYAWIVSPHGISTLLSTAQEQHIPLTLFTGFGSTIHALLFSVGWGLGYFGQPHILVNFMGIDNPHKIRSAEHVGMVWMILALVAAISVGLVGIIYFPHGLADPENLFVTLTQNLFSPFFAGLILCGIVAATLSSISTQLLISGSTFAEDIYKQLYPHASNKRQIWISRVGSTVVALCALIIAWNNSSSVYDLVNYAWSGLGSAFGPLVIVGLYGKHITWHAAFFGMLTGSIVSALWPYINVTLLPLIPGFFCNLAVLYLFSHALKKHGYAQQ